jgi:outer membrane protein OmpA-like peptidoglycan-associated protein
MFVKATLVVSAALLLADTAQPQGSPAAKSATTTAKRVADSTAKAAAGSATGTCGSGSIQIPQAFVAAVQALSGAAAANPAAVTSPMTCVRLSEAQTYMQTAAQALAARPGGAQMQAGMPPQAGGAQALAMAAAGNVANGASPAAAAASSGDMVKSGVATALAMTPQGMLVNGAVAAAPMAGSAMRAVTGRFSRGESKEGMAKDLSGGRLVMKGIRFADGADALADGSDQSIALLAAALQDVQGTFAVRLPAESDGKTPADTALARRRLERVAARLLVSGVSESRLTLVDPSTDVRKDKPPKPGDARLELVRAVEKP